MSETKKGAFCPSRGSDALNHILLLEEYMSPRKRSGRRRFRELPWPPTQATSEAQDPYLKPQCITRATRDSPHEWP